MATQHPESLKGQRINEYGTGCLAISRIDSNNLKALYAFRPCQKKCDVSHLRFSILFLVQIIAFKVAYLKNIFQNI